MTLSPIIERELRVAARRPGTFWIRTALVFVATLKSWEMLRSMEVGFLTGAALFRELASIAYFATLLMGLLTADSISRERRDGTLGLLLLTDLKPWQIVFGKMVSRGLIAAAGLAGFLPVLVLTVLAGGVRGFEAFCTAIGLLVDLFVVLAAGLWISATFRERTYAFGVTLMLIGVLGFGVEIFGAGLLGPGGAPVSRLLTLSGWRTLSQLPLLLSPVFVFWVALMLGFGWLFMFSAARALAKNWRDEPHEQIHEPETPDGWPAPPAIDERAAAPELMQPAFARASWLTYPRPWDYSPIQWRADHLGPVQGQVWLAMLLNCIGQFGLLASSFDSGVAGVISVGMLATVIFAGALLARVGARFFQETRQQGDFELLVTTPVGGRDILLGQCRVLRRALRVPVGLLLAFALFLAVILFIAVVLVPSAGYSRDELWSLVVTLLLAVSLIIESQTLCWMGMRCGLVAPNLLSAVFRALALAQAIPFVILFVIGAVLPIGRMIMFAEMPAIVLALLLWLAKNAALVVWARARLRRDLRLQN